MPRVVAPTVADDLRRRLAAGEWPGRTRMPPERALAAQYGIARNTLRSALRLLGAERGGDPGGFSTADGDAGSTTVDLVAPFDRNVPRGAADPSGSNPTSPEGADGGDHGTLLRAIRGMAGVGPADIMDVRLMLEPPATARAATNASTADLARIAFAHETACRSHDRSAFEHWDAELHEKIFDATRNDFLRELHVLMRAVRTQSEWLTLKARSFSPERRARYCDEHAAIVMALAARDGAAAHAAMAVHLTTVRANLLGV